MVKRKVKIERKEYCQVHLDEWQDQLGVDDWFAYLDEPDRLLRVLERAKPFSISSAEQIDSDPEYVCWQTVKDLVTNWYGLWPDVVLCLYFRTYDRGRGSAADRPVAAVSGVRPDRHRAGLCAGTTGPTERGPMARNGDLWRTAERGLSGPEFCRDADNRSLGGRDHRLDHAAACCGGGLALLCRQDQASGAGGACRRGYRGEYHHGCAAQWRG